MLIMCIYIYIYMHACMHNNNYVIIYTHVCIHMYVGKMIYTFMVGFLGLSNLCPNLLEYLEGNFFPAFTIFIFNRHPSRGKENGQFGLLPI